MEHMEQSYLRPLWDAIINLYERFDAYCRAHGFRYYVTGGTLLGAVRHNGFIPWDDDFDVVMPRPDYTRFIAEWTSSPMTECRLAAYELNAEYSFLFAKISDDRNALVTDVEEKSGLTLGDGICIDIIPIDGMPKATVPFYYWALKRSTWRHKGAGGVLWKTLLSILWGGDKSPAAFQRWLASYDYDTSPCVEDYNANGRRFRMRCLSAASFGTPVMHQFDRVEVPMPQEWDKFLRCIFGPDYMTPPPLEKQVPSHIRSSMV